MLLLYAFLSKMQELFLTFSDYFAEAKGRFAPLSAVYSGLLLFSPVFFVFSLWSKRPW